MNGLAATLALAMAACTALKAADDRPSASDAGHRVLIDASADVSSDGAPDSHAAGYECPTVVEYDLPTTSDAGAVSVAPTQIVTGPDKNLWFTLEYPLGWVPGTPSGYGNGIGRMAPDGGVTEFAVTPSSGPVAIGLGPANDLWFAEIAGGIGRVTFDAGAKPAVAEYGVPANSEPNGIAAGTDGNVWFTDYAHNAVVCVATDGGLLGTIPIPVANSVGTSVPNAIMTGASPVSVVTITEGIGALGAIRSVDAASVTQFAVPAGLPNIGGLALGPDGNIWFTDGGNNAIGVVDPSFAPTSFHEYALEEGYSAPVAIAEGPDHAMWFSEQQAQTIGRITLDGGITECAIPTANANATSITLGPDGAMWFTETNANRIGRFMPR